MAEPICSGEVWTDAHGFAAVALPRDADAELEIDVRSLTDGVSAELAAEPARRRFTVTTSEPHVKVAWKATSQMVTREAEMNVNTDEPARRRLAPPTQGRK
jgi:hypothetical protein